MQTTEDTVTRIGLYVLIGAFYAGSGYAHNVLDDADTEFDLLKFGKTIALGALAGAIVAARGEDAAPGAFEAVMAALVPIVDQWWNALRDNS